MSWWFFQTIMLRQAAFLARLTTMIRQLNRMIAYGRRHYLVQTACKHPLKAKVPPSKNYYNQWKKPAKQPLTSRMTP